jgi:hypothetical protein
MLDRFASRSPEQVKAAARSVLHQAVYAGTIVRQPCEVCGTTEKLHAHHEDYSKPLEVRWLCYLHHRQLHAARARGEVAA